MLMEFRPCVPATFAVVHWATHVYSYRPLARWRTLETTVPCATRSLTRGRTDWRDRNVASSARISSMVSHRPLAYLSASVTSMRVHSSGGVC